MSGEGILPLFFPPLHPGCLDLGKIVAEEKPQSAGQVPPDAFPGVCPQGHAVPGLWERWGPSPPVPRRPPRGDPQTRAGSAGKLREKKEEGEKRSALSAQHRAGPGAMSEPRAGWGGEGRAGGGCWGRSAAWGPAGCATPPQVGGPDSQSLPAAPQPVPERFLSLDFFGREKILAFCLKKKN